MLVFALNLEKVKEVCAGRVDLDQVLRGMGSWRRKGGHEEVLWSGDVFCDLDSFHDVFELEDAKENQSGREQL